ncbi:hypothetical protein MTY66_61560 (plasmid) [Mycolicibacterium sp. TY66]|uniref:hypothetical protein n=1 Tax=unclassified Mycolicibacterium TaxID=2636767 RepID=UPI001BB370C3|nr:MULTISPECIES: hypothetical protein [unclassified Mycolicibacterium]BCI84531.1 hypothetical protein MTY66_61560 [Mycolicibacterium sp. TY66]BCJ84761.1 hypothetical protein MTY81_61340 [Mycolicibacterium sp. TY81]
MANVHGADVLTRSQIEAWDVEHLDAAATYWSSTATQWEEHFTAIHEGTRRPGGTVWEGPAADAAADRTFGVLVTVRGAAEGLHNAASAARHGAADLAWVKDQALAAIAEAEQAQFVVAQDLSVTDPTMTVLMRGWQARQTQAQQFAAEISARTKTLAAIDKDIADKITAALTPVRELRFEESADAAAVPVSLRSMPPTGIVWCRDHPTGGYMCRELLPNGTISIFPSPTDISGHWPD